MGAREGTWLSWAEDLPPRDHERRGKYGDTHVFANPGGVVIFRTPTGDDREARRVWMETKGQAQLREVAQLTERNR